LNKNNPQPTLNLSLSSIYSIPLLHTVNANVKLHVTQTNHGRRKTNEDNQTNKPNQHINHESTKGKPQGMLHDPRPAEDAAPSEAPP
jgi:hypothetical protein